MSNPLTALAILPGIAIMILVYKFDKVEKEPVLNILKYAVLGAAIVIPCALTEYIFVRINTSMFGNGPMGYMMENFVCVAAVEEGFKFLVLAKLAFRDKNFNYTFDGVVYSVAVSMGFAIAENMSYVRALGLQAALVRMFTAVPAHAVFGIFMGIFFGLGLKSLLYENRGMKVMKVSPFLPGAVIPVLYHGFYDSIADSSTVIGSVVFIFSVIIMDWIAYLALKGASQNDSPID